MKIGIITFHETTNFGSLLQTYALYKVLNDKGMDCDVIDYQCEEIIKREFKYEKIRKISIKNILKYILFSKQSVRKHNCLLDFLKENVTLSSDYKKKNISESNYIYDCFIVGSDIVWGLDVTGEDWSYFLDFTEENKLRISYASSANEIADSKYTDKIVNQLKRFDMIGVREEKCRTELLEYIPNKEICLVCDPTMLIVSEVWRKLALTSKYSEVLKGKNYVLMYFPDADGKMLRDAKSLKKKKKLEVYCINDKLPLPGVRNIHISRVEDFLCFILYAQVVLSGSYHGSLFSMYFERDYYYYVRAHGERMKTLANILGVEERQAKYIDTDKSVDYSEVSGRIDMYRKQSFEYVDKVIGRIMEYEIQGKDM